MYCTTNPKQIEAEVATSRNIVDKLSGNEHILNQAGLDALASARATIALYADLLDDNDKCAEYRPVGSVGRQCARAMGQRQIAQAKSRGEWRGNNY